VGPGPQRDSGKQTCAWIRPEAREWLSNGRSVANGDTDRAQQLGATATATAETGDDMHRVAVWSPAADSDLPARAGSGSKTAAYRSVATVSST
jgi:hypothetical protein